MIIGIISVILALGALFVIFQFIRAFIYIMLHLDKKSRAQNRVVMAKRKNIKHKQHDYWDEPGGLQYVQLPDGTVRID